MAAQTEHRLIRRVAEIEKIPPSMVHDLHAYWLGKRGEQVAPRNLPAWADIQPAEIRRLLPNLIVTGIEHDPFRVRYRLAGTQIVEFRGEITGHCLGDVPWSSTAGQAVVMEGFQRVVAERIPLFSEVDITTRNGAHHQIFTGIWPLAPASGAPIDRCLALEDYGALSRDEFL
jgi:hypothetical protein